MAETIKISGMKSSLGALRRMARAAKVAAPAPVSPFIHRPGARPPLITTPWTRIPQPDGSFVMRPGKPVIQDEEIGTAHAARILGLSQRRIESMCDEGVLAQGEDWWRMPGSSRPGKYRIKLASVMRLRMGEG